MFSILYLKFYLHSGALPNVQNDTFNQNTNPIQIYYHNLLYDMKIDLVNSLFAQLICIAAFTAMWLIVSWITIRFSFNNNWMT